MVPRESKDRWVRLDLKVSRAFRVPLDPKVIREFKVQLDHKGRKVNRAP